MYMYIYEYIFICIYMYVPRYFYLYIELEFYIYCIWKYFRALIIFVERGSSWQDHVVFSVLVVNYLS